MTVPADLVRACERNRFVWRREDPEMIDAAFEELGLKRNGQLFEFAKRYCLQFASDTLPFQLADFVDDEGISDTVFYAREELRIDPKMLPISPFEAEAIYVVHTENDQVLLLTPSSDDRDWIGEVVSESFYAFMLEHLD